MTARPARPMASRIRFSPSTTGASTRAPGGPTRCLYRHGDGRSSPLMRTFTSARSDRKVPPRTVYVGSHEDKLSRIPAIRVDPDYDGRSREDLERERAERRTPYLLLLAPAL